jgi:hypothetical protein
MPRKRLFPPPKHPQTGKPLHNKGREPRSVLTVNARVVLQRRRWSAPVVGSVTPLDAWLDAAEDTISLGARELACRLNQGSSNFDKAAANLARAAQVSLSGEFLRQVVEAEGRAVQAAQRAGTLTIGWTAAECRIPSDPPDGTDRLPEGSSAVTTRVYLGADGVKLPLVTDTEKQARRQKVKEKRRRRGRKCRPLPRAKRGADQRYKEFKIVTYYDEGQAHRHVSVTAGDHQVAGALMRRDAARIALHQAEDKVAVVDGAEWIRKQIERQSLGLDALGLDFYHLADNVHQARRVVYGEEDAAGVAWAGGILHTAKHEGYAALRDQLVVWKSRLRSRRKRRAAEQLLGYVTDRRAMIGYPEFLAVGRQIGSGPTESMCKATTQRLKGSGMRWDAENAEAIMALEALDQSGEWKQYWASYLKPAA